MFSALAAAMAPRRRGLPSGSPPPVLAAMVISLMRRVKILPRLASSAPFLCLIVAHFEWPELDYLGGDLACSCGVLRAYSTLRSYHVGAGVGLADGGSGGVGGDGFYRLLCGLNFR